MDEWDIYTSILAAAAGYGGSQLGLGGERRDLGAMVSMIAAMVFAVPMGLWFAFNLITYLLRGDGHGFEAGDVRGVLGLLIFGIGVWLGGVALGYAIRLRGRY